MEAKYPGDRAPPTDIDVGLTVSVGIQYIGFRAGNLREKHEGRWGGSGVRTPADRPY